MTTRDILSPRQRQTLFLRARGRRNAEIAAELGIRSSGVHRHLAMAKLKLMLPTLAEAIAWAREQEGT